jgi:hypothetical protein
VIERETEPLSLFCKRLGISLPRGQALVRAGIIRTVPIPGPALVPREERNRLLLRGEAVGAAKSATETEVSGETA